MSIQKGLPQIRRVHGKTTKQFVLEAKAVHGRRYNYSKVSYVTSRIPVLIVCRKHGEFAQSPGVHLAGSNCPECAKLSGIENNPKRLTTKDFIKAAKKVHGNRYDYRQTVYTSVRSKVTIICREHGAFEQLAQRHLQGYRCTKCGASDAGSRRIDTQEAFIKKAKAKHGSLYDYSKVKYVRSNLPVTLVCQKHGEFSQKANNHIQGAGCPRCKVTLPYSKIAIEWIEKEARKRRLRNVQHAENGGEIRIPGTRYWVDGYHDRTKTVFEFYGDAFHGNLNVYKPTSRPHPFNESTARKLYNATMRRREELVLLGYKVISIWEHDYKELRNEH